MSVGGRISNARLIVGALAGTVYGAVLGWADLSFLARFVDFKQPNNFSDLPGEFVGYLLIGMNAGCGLALGLAGASLLPRRRSLLARVLPGSVLGGYLGALVGFLDLLVIASNLNLLDSDLVAIWRENRSPLVILNATASAVVGSIFAAYQSRSM